MFASKVTSQVVFDDGVVNIRKLSARSLEKASEARQISVSQLSRSMGPELMRAFATPTEDRTKVEPSLEERTRARYATYDRQSVLQAGVVSWTYDTKVAEGLDDLDEESAQKLHEAILDLSLPPLDPVEREAVHSKD